MDNQPRPKVSVIVSAYNGRRFIQDTLMSIKNQTLSQFECIIIDDGSMDDTRDVIKKAIDGDSRFIFIPQDNIGKPKSLNKGLKIVKGKYVMMLDHDDLFHYDMLQKLYNKAEQAKSEITVCDFQNFNDKTMKVTPSPLNLGVLPRVVFSIDNMSNDVFFSQPLYPTCYNKLWSHDFLRKNNLLFDNRAWPAEDELFETKALLLANRIAVVDDVLIDYRLSEDQVTSNRVKNYQDASYFVYGKIHDILAGDVRGKAWEVAFHRLIAGFAVSFVDLAIETCDSKLQQKIFKNSHNLLEKILNPNEYISSPSDDFLKKLTIIRGDTILEYYNHMIAEKDTQIIKLQNSIDMLSSHEDLNETLGIKASVRLLIGAIKRRLS